MTTLAKNLVCSSFGRKTVVLACALGALAVGGCESSTNVLGNNTAPQATLTPPPAGPTAATQLAKMQVAPIIGSPENVSRDLQTQLTAAIERNRMTVPKEANGQSEYTLRGYVVAAREAQKNASKISYIWDVTDQTGKRVHRITGEEIAASPSKDPWAAVTPQVVQSIADKTASQIASWLPGSAAIPVASAAPATQAAGAVTAQPIGNVAAAAPAPASLNAPTTIAAATPPSGVTTGPTTGSIGATGPVTTLVPTVTGAPGDGSQSLTAAIQKELSKNGVSLANAAGTSTYKVEGKVAVGQAKDGKQPITIDWNVLDPTGKKVGTVSQKNEIPQGSLDGTWGKTADAAAAAAAQGIIKLLPPNKGG